MLITEASDGTQLLARRADKLSGEFGKGFDERNLRHMRAFYAGFPIWNALRSELSWTHYRTLLTEDELRAELDREQRLLLGQTAET